MAHAEPRVESTPGRAPSAPTDLRPRSWWALVKRTVREFMDDELMDRAAALTYFGVLALFPGLIVMAAIVGVIGESATRPLIENLGVAAPTEVRDIVVSGLEGLSRDRGAAGVLLVVGLAVALWTASGYIAAFMRASNAVYEVEEGRPFWKLRPLQLAVTLLLIVLLALVGFAVVLTGTIAEEVGGVIGVGDEAVAVWDIAKWPFVLLGVMTIFAILYWVSPNVVPSGFHWISPGSVVGVLIWIVVSALFALYVANFGSYNKTYGSLGGVAVFLVWMWLSNIALLLGQELNSEVERARQIEAGDAAPGGELAVEYRDPPKGEDSER